MGDQEETGGWRQKGYADTADHVKDAQDRTFWKSKIRPADPTYWEKAKKKKLAGGRAGGWAVGQAGGLHDFVLD